MSHDKQNDLAGGEGELPQLISELHHKNGMRRRHAREALQRLGRSAVPRLIELLKSPQDNVRWEAAKALGHIADPTAGSALVGALKDEAFEVQWLAAEALIAMGKDAVEPLLEGIVRHYDSVFLRQGAHHVLHDLERKGLLSPAVVPVLDELRSLEPLEPYPTSAKRALEEIHEEQNDAGKSNSN